MQLPENDGVDGWPNSLAGRSWVWTRMLGGPLQSGLVHWQNEREYASPGVSALDINPATMRERDLTRETEADARAGGFRAKKWYEDLVNEIRRGSLRAVPRKSSTDGRARRKCFLARFDRFGS